MCSKQCEKGAWGNEKPGGVWMKAGLGWGWSIGAGNWECLSVSFADFAKEEKRRGPPELDH